MRADARRCLGAGVHRGAVLMWDHLDPPRFIQSDGIAWNSSGDAPVKRRSSCESEQPHPTLIGATGDARQAREILCACEAGDLARVNRMAMSATADTMRLALWVLACKSVRACGDEDGN